MSLECDHDCVNKTKVYCDCQWGSDNMPTQTATFCKEHAEALWEMLNPLLQLNKAWYRIGPPGSIKGEKNDKPREIGRDKKPCGETTETNTD